MSGLDLFVDGFPHGTPQGYDEGCQGGTCPAGVEYGLSCKVAKSKSRGDYQYQKLVKQGATIPEIADALGLVGTATAPAKKKPKPTPATAQGGVSLADAAANANKAAVAMGIEPSDVDEFVDSATALASMPTPEEPKKKVWEKKRPAPAADTADAKTTAPKPSEIREWARSRGYEVGTKGKLPQHIIEHYWDATGRLDSTSTAVDTIEPPADTEAPELVIEIAQSAKDDTEAAIEVPTALPETLSSPRPEWSTVAALADLEAARSIAVRLEQELAHVTEEREAARSEAESIGHLYIGEVEKVIKLAERLDRRTQERDRAEHLQGVAERASSLLLTKWGEERAANEAAHALIVHQAHAINRLTDLLPEPINIAPIDFGPGALFDFPSEPTPDHRPRRASWLRR